MTKTTRSIGIVLFVILLILIRFYWYDFAWTLYNNRHEQLFNDVEKGFVLYLDSRVDYCSSCFSELITFDEVQSIYSEANYSVVVGYSEADSDYYKKWIQENVFAGFSSQVVIDCENIFARRYNLSEGSKVLFFDAQSHLVSISNPQEKSARDYLVLFKNHFQ